MKYIMAGLAFAVLLGFLGILAIHVPQPDLLAVIGLCVALVAYDFVTSLGKDKS
ncbi:MAG: hypothetical protein ACPGNV_00290 [Mangrovicoccus sp.]